MKAMDWPSGDQRGTAICRPWSGPETSEGTRMAVGLELLVSQVSEADLHPPDEDLSRGPRTGGTRGCGGWGNRDGLGVEFGDPPVVFAGRVGGDVGEGFRVRGPVELEDVEIGRSGEDRDGWLGRIGGDHGDALNLDTIFSDDAGGQGLGRKGVCGTSCACDVEEGDGLPIGEKAGAST